MKQIFPSFKKIRIIILIFLFIILFLSIGLIKKSFAITGFLHADGSCRTWGWNWSEREFYPNGSPYGGGKIVSLNTYNGSIGGTEWTFPGYRMNVKNYKWDSNQGWFEWTNSSDVVSPASSKDFILNHMAEHGIAENQYPWQYWPNGPPEGCSDPPPPPPECSNCEPQNQGPPDICPN
jgi:hypothetical protein